MAEPERIIYRKVIADMGAGRAPSMVPDRLNRIVGFAPSSFASKKWSMRYMGDTTRKLFSHRM